MRPVPVQRATDDKVAGVCGDRSARGGKGVLSANRREKDVLPKVLKFTRRDAVPQSEGVDEARVGEKESGAHEV